MKESDKSRRLDDSIKYKADRKESTNIAEVFTLKKNSNDIK